MRHSTRIKFPQHCPRNILSSVLFLWVSSSIVIGELASTAVHVQAITGLPDETQNSAASSERFLGTGTEQNRISDITLDSRIIDVSPVAGHESPVQKINLKDLQSNQVATQSTQTANAPDSLQTIATTSTNSTLLMKQSQIQPELNQQPHCKLGDDIFQIGERWNPNLPPFGVQVCVLCECEVRQRKSCFETKVTCRRITNECPIIDSCPDGKRPVTVPGQCCKSCQSASPTFAQQDSNHHLVQEQKHPQAIIIRNQSPSHDTHNPAQQSMPSSSQTPPRIVYMNERSKEYMSIMKSLPQCPSRDSETKPIGGGSQPMNPIPIVTKTPKGGRSDLNGIDTRLAFKSLHDTASNHLNPPKGRFEYTHEKALPGHASGMSSDGFNRRAEQQQQQQQHVEDNYQHPNDVQYASGNSNSNSISNVQQHQQIPGTSYSRARPLESTAGRDLARTSSHCVLGNDTFQVGDVWNPILPPFGVQPCVQCNCIFRVRKGCYETKVTCRRVNRDCPIIDVCPDGKPPIIVGGQCCKSCPILLNNLEQQPITMVASVALSIIQLDGIQRNEKVFREFATVSRNMEICVRSRESVDIYNTNRYARRSQKA